MSGKISKSAANIQLNPHTGIFSTQAVAMADTQACVLVPGENSVQPLWLDNTSFDHLCAVVFPAIFKNRPIDIIHFTIPNRPHYKYALVVDAACFTDDTLAKNTLATTLLPKRAAFALNTHKQPFLRGPHLFYCICTNGDDAAEQLVSLSNTLMYSGFNHAQ